ncbi:DUF397 domain-containing protein [Sphaerisporangium fuscum]|uniref:DUF397 domain-containing protein n=1 Tax=Sphaerisporangium fuscum TaxID=2835868 RepID=UPI001BDCBB0C|nr:DUF397 domain-containing protein [Sphaerisporangium fuscum]
MSTFDTDTLVWRKSSHSGNGQNCVEVALFSEYGRFVRDSKISQGPAVAVATEAWGMFIAAVRQGVLTR